MDILLITMMNARLDSADKVKSVWQDRHKIEEALAEIPMDLPLESENVPWKRSRFS